MSNIIFTFFRFGILALLWIFTAFAIHFLRKDLIFSKSPQPTTPHDFTQHKKKSALQLIVKNGPLEGTIIPLKDAIITFGRAADCTLVIDEPFVSNYHAAISPVEDLWIVEDLESTNGVFVNEKRIFKKTELKINDEVKIGHILLKLEK